MKRSYGFTITELVVVIVFAALAGIVLLYQKGNIEASQRDETRKTAINAMYYNLEEVFYEKNKYYPETISVGNLTAMDSELFTDPSGAKLGETGSDYRYEAVACENDRCRGYTLRTRLEKEADYIKMSQN